MVSFGLIAKVIATLIILMVMSIMQKVNASSKNNQSGLAKIKIFIALVIILYAIWSTY